MTFKATGQDSVFNAFSLTQRLQQPKALLAPGVYDALSALIAEQAGFESWRRLHAQNRAQCAAC